MEEKKGMSKKNKAFIVVFGILVIVGAIFGIAKFIHGLHHEETEDAQVEANISPVLAKIQGYVKELRVDDNQFVHQGDTLVVLDDRDLQVRVDQAEAALENAQANLASTRASLSTARDNQLTAQSNLDAAKASVQVAQVRERRARQDYDRYQALIQNHSITQQQFDQAQAEMESAEKQLEVAKGQEQAAATELSARRSQQTVSNENITLAQTVVKQRQADLDFAKLQESYAYITAPYDGVISRKSAELGQLVQAGQALFAIVDQSDKWVVANFKETQLEKMRPGQDVEIDVDAFPGETFKGKVESISPATGARFALLPADNASGNFVKVVQRVPVKVDISDAPEKEALLRAGMNAIVDVHLN